MFGGSKHINTVQYQKYWKVWPSPTSYYNALHWGQMFNEGKDTGEPHFFEFNVSLYVMIERCMDKANCFAQVLIIALVQA